MNFVYENPSILSLSRFIRHWAASGGTNGVSSSNGSSAKAAEMRRLLETYAARLKGRAVEAPATNGISKSSANILLVTGTTGHLGSFILEKAIRDPNVAKVIAFNRNSSEAGSTLFMRQCSSFRAVGIDSNILNNEKIELLAGDYAHDTLGLSPDKFKEVRSRHRYKKDTIENHYAS